VKPTWTKLVSAPEHAHPPPNPVGYAKRMNFHPRPFQKAEYDVAVLPAAPAEPTATQSVADTHVTPVSDEPLPRPAPGGAGSLTSFHALPFHEAAYCLPLSR
jgi:hypothetical protein